VRLTAFRVCGVVCRYFVVTANIFFGNCRFLGGFILFVTEASAKSGIEPDPAYSIHTSPAATDLGLDTLFLDDGHRLEC
jgi:hypothetical protein